MTPLEHYEAEAEEFYRATGMMAPGKDQPGYYSNDGFDERQMCWTVWTKARGKLLSALQSECARGERMRNALEEVARLPDHYTTDIFPEPDFKRAHELLVAGGMTLDALSASAGRDFTGIAADIAKQALTDTTPAAKEHT